MELTNTPVEAVAELKRFFQFVQSLEEFDSLKETWFEVCPKIIDEQKTSVKGIKLILSKLDVSKRVVQRSETDISKDLETKEEGFHLMESFLAAWHVMLIENFFVSIWKERKPREWVSAKRLTLFCSERNSKSKTVGDN